MARFKNIFSSFLGGEISPKAYGRLDVERYRNSCEELRNMLVYPQGGAGKRPGTQFISDNETFNEFDPDEVITQGIRLVPFVISKDEAYIIIFDCIIRNTGHPVLDPGEDRGITIYDIRNDTMVYPVPFEASPQDFSKFAGFLTDSELAEMQYAQYGGAIFFAHKNHPPFCIQKQFGSTNTFSIVPFWAYAELGENLGAEFPTDAEIAKAWPYTTRNVTTITVTIDTASGVGRTLTASDDIFNESQVGSLIRVTNATSTKTGVAVITGYTDEQTVTVRVLVSFGDTAASENWAFSSWSDYRGWPASVCFYENRIVYGGNRAQPAFWGSRTGNLSDMRQEHYIDDSPNTVTNDDPFEFTPASAEVNEVQWVSSAKTLSIGTFGREYVAFGPDPASAFGPLNFKVVPQSAVGSSYVQPVRREDALLFVQRSQRNLKEFVFNFQEDAYKAIDVMLFSEHMIKKMQRETGTFSTPRIIGLCQQDVDNQITWAWDTQGGLFAATRNRDLEINAFHYHPIAGTYEDETLGTIPAKVLSCCVAPSLDGTHDDLYLGVLRTIDGADCIYLERIGREFDGEESYNTSADVSLKMIYSDSAVMSQEGSPTTTHSGFDHLIGQTVSIVADGHYVGTKVVNASGEIELDDAATEVIAGLGYTARLKTTNINDGTVFSTTQGTPKSVDTVTLRFNKTIGAKYGFDGGTLDQLEFRDWTTAQDDPINPFTGDKEVAAPEGWENKLNIVVEQDLPLPCHVDAIVYRGLAND